MATLVSIHKNPHSMDQCNECGKKKEAGEEFSNSAKHEVLTDGNQTVAHERPICAECLKKERAA